MIMVGCTVTVQLSDYFETDIEHGEPWEWRTNFSIQEKIYVKDEFARGQAIAR